MEIKANLHQNAFGLKHILNMKMTFYVLMMMATAHSARWKLIKLIQILLNSDKTRQDDDINCLCISFAVLFRISLAWHLALAFIFIRLVHFNFLSKDESYFSLSLTLFLFLSSRYM